MTSSFCALRTAPHLIPAFIPVAATAVRALHWFCTRLCTTPRRHTPFPLPQSPPRIFLPALPFTPTLLQYLPVAHTTLCLAYTGPLDHDCSVPGMVVCTPRTQADRRTSPRTLHSRRSHDLRNDTHTRSATSPRQRLRAYRSRVYLPRFSFAATPARIFLHAGTAIP